MSRLISTSDFRNVVIKRKSEYGKLATLISAIVDEMVRETPTVPAIPLDKIKKVRKQIIDEKEFAYADFEQYKEDVLHVEPDELPDDDFRFGMERCLAILDKLIESEE